VSAVSKDGKKSHEDQEAKEAKKKRYEMVIKIKLDGRYLGLDNIQRSIDKY
jgi:hypothetical protein